MRCLKYLLLFCSILLGQCPFMALAQQPIPAKLFLQSLEPAPSASDLYDFFDIYDEEFAACKEIPTYLRAISYILANGDVGVAAKRLSNIIRCPALTVAEQRGVIELQDKLPRPATVTVAEQPAIKEQPAIAEEAVIPVLTPKAIPGVVAQAPAEQEKSAISAEQAPKATPAVKVKAEKKAPPVPVQPRNDTSIISAVASKPKQKTPAAPVESTLSVKRATPPLLPVSIATVKEQPKRVSVNTFNDWRSGDKGTSRLYRSENTITGAYGAWSVSAASIYLNSGNFDGSQSVGTAFTSKQKSSLTTEATLFTPQLAYVHDKLAVSVSSTPMGADITPLPTGKIAWQDKRFSVSAFQENVTDSLLSYVGFKDIHSDKTMGRVVKAGGKLGWADSFADTWFYGTAITGAHLYGHNVKENNAVKGEAYVGKNFGLVSAGIYSSADHFTRNLNNFTYGHGGYYSPQVAAATALFVSIDYTVEKWKLNADVSAGYLYEKIESSQQYYGTSEKGTPYTADESQKFTINTGLDLLYHFDSGFSFKGTTRFLHAGDFTEGKLGMNLQYEF